MTDLEIALLNRQQQPIAPTGLPAVPPNPHSHLPPAQQRFQTGLKMQQAIANNWNPNPALVRVLDNK